MSDHRGPLDCQIETLVSILVRKRGTPRDKHDPRDKEQFESASKAIEKFVIRVGIFATDDIRLIDAVFGHILHGVEGYIGALGWIRGPLWLLANLCRTGRKTITPSEKLYLEVRKRIQFLKANGYSNDVPRDDVTRFKEDLDPRLKEIFFDEYFKETSCAQRLPGVWNKLRTKSADSCVKGCDLLLLRRLGFTDPLVGRIAALRPDTLAVRIGKCISKVSKSRTKVGKPVAVTLGR